MRVARIFNTYGPRMRLKDGRIISNFVVQALTGGPLTVYGDGKQTRSFCFVSDLIDGIIKLMNSDHPGEYINFYCCITHQKVPSILEIQMNIQF